MPYFIGFATIVFAALITLPSLNKLLEQEERREVKGNLSFFQEHEEVIDFSLYFFIGVFLVFFVIGLSAPANIFSLESIYGEPATQTEPSKIKFPKFEVDNKTKISGIIWNNIYVLVISFLLSVFYGSGSIFIILLNSSIFASALASAVRLKFGPLSFAAVSCNLSVMFFHTLPELSSYFLAAIAGGVLSKAVIKERHSFQNIKKITYDGFKLMLLAIAVLILAAFIEVFVSDKMFTTNACTAAPYYPPLFFLFAILFIIWFEIYRNKFHRRKHKKKL